MPERSNSRHGLEDGLNTISEGELVDNVLLGLVKVDLPGVLARGSGQLDIAVVVVAQVVEQVLVKARVLHVVWSNLQKAEIN